MFGRSLLLTTTALLGTMAFAEPLPEVPIVPPTPLAAEAPADQETPAELTDLNREHDAARKALDQKDAQEIAALRDWYAGELDKMRQDAISQGDLDKVVALDLERGAINDSGWKSDSSPEPKGQLFYSLRELRGRYLRLRSEHVRHILAEGRAVLLGYAVALDRLAGLLLSHGNVAGATVVERARLMVLGAAPTTAVAWVPPSCPSPGSSAPTVPTVAKATPAASKSNAAPVTAAAPRKAPSTEPTSGPRTASTAKATATPGKTTSAGRSGPSATSVSAPTQVAKRTAPQSGGKSAPTMSRPTGGRPAGPSAPYAPGASSGFVVR